MREEKLINEILFLDERKLFKPVFLENENEIHLEPTDYYKKIEKILKKVAYSIDIESLLKVNKRVYEYTKKIYKEQFELHGLPVNDSKFENIDYIIHIGCFRGAHNALMKYAHTFTDNNILLLMNEYKSSGEDLAKLAIKCGNRKIKYEIVSRIIDEELPEYYLDEILIAEYKDEKIVKEIIKVIYNRDLIMVGKALSDKSLVLTDKIRQELISRFNNRNATIDDLRTFSKEVLHQSLIGFITSLLDPQLGVRIDSNELVEYIISNDKELTEKNLATIEEKLLKVDAESLVLYAKNIGRANLAKIENELIERGNLGALLDFASEIKFVDMDRLEKMILARNDINLIAGLEIVKAKRGNYKIDNKKTVIQLLNSVPDPKIVYMLSKYCAEEYLKQCEHYLRVSSDEYLRYYYEDRRKK